MDNEEINLHLVISRTDTDTYTVWSVSEDGSRKLVLKSDIPNIDLWLDTWVR
jgi:hypothetical protein